MFEPFSQMKNIPYGLPYYSTEPYHSAHTYLNGRYSVSANNQLAQYGVNSVSSMHPMDRQYLYEQRWNYLNAMQRGNLRRQADTMALSMYARPLLSSYSTAARYSCGIKNQSMKYSNFDGLGVRRSSPPKLGGYGHPLNPAYSEWVTINVLNTGNARGLSPKIRAVFFPSGPMPVQQPCLGPLSMPPFLFTHVSQPFYSLPLPPTLPEVASLYLENNVQQILMQCYINPVPPLTPNWPISPPVVTSNPHLQQQSILFPSAFHSYQSTLPIDNTPLYYSNGNRNASPSLFFNNFVTNPSWIHNRLAPNHIPVPRMIPNFQSIDGRITPLLSRSTVPLMRLNQISQRYQESYIRTPNSRDFSSQKTPPFLPGAVLLHDEYLNKSTFLQERKFLNKRRKSSRHATINKILRRSIMINTNNANRIKPKPKGLMNERTATESNIRNQQPFGNSKSVASSRSRNGSSIHDSINRGKTITGSTERSDNARHIELPSEVASTSSHDLTATQDNKIQLISNKKKLKSSSNSDMLRDLRPSIAIRDNQLGSPPSRSHSTFATIRDNNFKEDLSNTDTF